MSEASAQSPVLTATRAPIADEAAFESIDTEQTTVDAVDPANPSEDRTHPRVRIEVDVTARSSDTFWVGVTENISEGGLFVATSCPWPEGTSCELTVALDDGGSTLHVEGVVAWIREDRGDGLTPGMGVTFDSLAAQHRTRIQGYVKEHIARTVLWE